MTISSRGRKLRREHVASSPPAAHRWSMIPVVAALPVHLRRYFVELDRWETDVLRSRGAAS